jgi:hypothetical protein
MRSSPDASSSSWCLMVWPAGTRCRRSGASILVGEARRNRRRRQRAARASGARVRSSGARWSVEADARLAAFRWRRRLPSPETSSPNRFRRPRTAAARRDPQLTPLTARRNPKTKVLAAGSNLDWSRSPPASIHSSRSPAAPLRPAILTTARTHALDLMNMG